MPSITQLAGRIAKSPTIAMNDKAKQLAAEGHAVIGLAGGEPDFDTPAHIVDAAMKALRDGKTRYAAPSKGITPLLEAIAAKMERDNGVKVNPASDIIITPGGKLALFLALKAMLDPGDEVLIPAPFWVSYPSIVTMVGGRPVTVPTDSSDNYRLRLEQLRELVTPRTKAIIVNSPNNPTGHMLSSAEIEAVATLAVEADLFVISDDIYEKLNFDGTPAISLASIPDIADRVVVINGMSKAYAMTGWRLGWLAGETSLIASRRQVQFADRDIGRHLHPACGGGCAEWSAGLRRDDAQSLRSAPRLHGQRLQQHPEYVLPADRRRLLRLPEGG